MAHRYAIRKVERGAMDEPPISREEYVRKVLEAYCHTSGTTGTVRRPDRLLAAQLHQRGVPLTPVENALILAAARRLLRSNTAPPLAMVRSLAYFLPVIEEVLQLKIKDEYFQYIRRRLQRFNSAHT
jgi:hypothetical protein